MKIRKTEYQYAYYWNRGGFKDINEDSIGIQHVVTRQGQVLLACVCDGMGGLAQGEVASGYIVEEVSKWFYQVLLPILRKTKKGSRRQTYKIKKACFRQYFFMNQEILNYGKRNTAILGTTATILILLDEIYYLFHIGDCKMYEIRSRKKAKQITVDHSVDKFTLTKCLGINSSWKPDFVKRKVKNKRGLLICSDGFIHKIEREVLFAGLQPRMLDNEKKIERALKEIGNRCIQRGERDNLSAIYIRTN